MSFDFARQTIATHLKTQWALSVYAAVPIEYENIAIIDHNQRNDPFITFEIEWHDPEQVAMDASRTRYNGEILIWIHEPGGAGTKHGNLMLQALADILKYKLLSGIQLHVARPGTPDTVKSWHLTPLRTSFFYTE